MRFSLPEGARLRPYCLTAAMNRDWLEARLPKETRWLDPLCEEDVAYCVALNRANSFAHDGAPQPGSAPTALGMPRWVMLDCCLLPTAMIGFETERASVPSALADALDPSGALEWIAVSEYVGIPSVETGRFVGVSLFSLVRGAGLGARSKALGLRALGCSELIGVTQYSSPGVSVHLAFGPLAIVTSRVAVHSRPGETFVYRLDVPDNDALRAMAEGTITIAPGYNPDEWVPLLSIDPREADQRERAAALAAQAPTWIVAHGPVVDGALTRLDFARPK